MKPNLFKIILGIITILTMFSLESCLKDKDFDDGITQSLVGNGKQNVIEISITAAANNNHVQFAFDNVDKDTTINAVPVVLAGDPATEDIQVTLIVNPALLGEYNTNNGTTHAEFPTSLYSVTNPGDSTTGYIVTIPKGSNVGYLQVTVNPAKIIGLDYALGMQISNIQPAGYLVSSNFSSGIAAVGTKNQFDGVYDFKGSVLRQADNVLSGNFSGQEAELITTGSYSNTFKQVWADGSGVGGIDGLTVTINPLTNKVKVSSTTNPVLTNNPVYDNRYDPDTKTYYISFYWGTGITNRAATDTLIYSGPR